jgi:hypothetical protein
MVKIIFNFWCMVWRRIADGFTAVDITTLFSGGAVSAAISAVLNAPGWAIFGFGLVGACIGLGLLIAWQEWNRGELRQDAGPKEASKSFPVEGFQLKSRTPIRSTLFCQRWVSTIVLGVALAIGWLALAYTLAVLMP